MKRLILTLAITAALFGLEGSSAGAVGFNTAMFDRYPWAHGTSMTRFQGWDSGYTHSGDLKWAVDWDTAIENWPARAANGGTIRCGGSDAESDGLGIRIGVYNSTANSTSIYAHLASCGPFVP